MTWRAIRPLAWIHRCYICRFTDVLPPWSRPRQPNQVEAPGVAASRYICRLRQDPGTRLSPGLSLLHVPSTKNTYATQSHTGHAGLSSQFLERVSSRNNVLVTAFRHGIFSCTIVVPELVLASDPVAPIQLGLGGKPIYAKSSHMARHHIRYYNNPVISIVVPFHPSRLDIAITSMAHGVHMPMRILLTCTQIYLGFLLSGQARL